MVDEVDVMYHVFKRFRCLNYHLLNDTVKAESFSVLGCPKNNDVQTKKWVDE